MKRQIGINMLHCQASVFSGATGIVDCLKRGGLEKYSQGDEHFGNG